MFKTTISALQAYSGQSDAPDHHPHIEVESLESSPGIVQMEESHRQITVNHIHPNYQETFDIFADGTFVCRTQMTTERNLAGMKQIMKQFGLSDTEYKKANKLMADTLTAQGYIIKKADYYLVK